MVKRVKPPETVRMFKKHIGFGLSMEEELKRLKSLLSERKFTAIQLSPMYTMTRHWRYIRKCALRRDDFTCQNCGAKDTILHVHHLRYRGFGEEQLQDLQTLCAECHNKESSYETQKRVHHPIKDVGNRQLFEVMSQEYNEDMRWSWY